MGDDPKPKDSKFDVRLVIGSLSAIAILIGFISYISIQLKSVDDNTKAIDKQELRIDDIEKKVYSVEHSTIQNKMQNTHNKDTIGLFHNFGDNNE